MKFISTRGGEKVTGAQAIVQGLAKNGGLFVPEKFPKITSEEMDAMAEMTYPQRAAFVLGKYLADDLGADYLLESCEKAYSTFTGNDPAPLVKIDKGLYILELFHGPTCAFKDMALTVLPYLLKKSCEVTGIDDEILILAATSGDTGKAALEGFRDVKGTKVAVFYPDEGVAKMQRLQMCIQDGNNVFVAAVKGNFDDCQRAVKNLFASEEFNVKLAEKKTRLSSANSINFGRLAPQIAYYFSAYLDMTTSGKIEMGDEVDFVVPTGNFGDILAGWYAKQMGLPVRKLVCASNRNKVLADFFEKGVYDVKRNFFRTMSPSMDILVSSNLERLLFEISGRNGKLTAQRMKQLAENKEYSITEEEKAVLDKEFFGGFASEDDTIEAMYETFEEYGYAMDTHTGVALAVHAQYRKSLEKEGEKEDEVPSVVLSTANPYKFPQDVLYALSGNDVKDSFKGIKRLNLLTAMKPPKSLLDLRYRPLRFKTVVDNDLSKMAAEILKFADGHIVPVPDAD
ncbi:MAG: threonine synthase [Clostridia bacterium]|nr:threonine synthase [Clostridiales bacterium]MBQ3505429.1 threonine synthase [Clostridia bacterium]